MENQIGLVYEFDKYDDFRKLLFEVVENPEILNAMKSKCVIEAEKYLPENVIGIMTKKFN